MPLTAEALVFDTTSAGDPHVAPDGSRLVYTVARAERAADRVMSYIWLSRIDGSEARQLTWAGKSNREARWSPDGRWITIEQPAESLMLYKPTHEDEHGGEAGQAPIIPRAAC